MSRVGQKGQQALKSYDESLIAAGSYDQGSSQAQGVKQFEWDRNHTRRSRHESGAKRSLTKQP